MGKRSKKVNAKRNLKVIAWIYCAVAAFLIILIFLLKGYLLKEVKTAATNGTKKNNEVVITAETVPELKVAETPSKKKFSAKVAIIIDDLGWNYEAANLILGMNIPLTLAILPNQKFSLNIAKRANDLGLEIILHIPMEPKEELKSLPQFSILSVEMDDEEIKSLTDEYLKAFPFIKGVNNHMGSRFTEDGAKMKAFLNSVKKNNLFFVDSMTTSSSVGFTIAKEMGIPSTRRHVFLDHDEDSDSIRKRIEELQIMSLKYGYAVGIGHPKENTIAVLKEMRAHFEEKGIALVPVSELVN